MRLNNYLIEKDWDRIDKIAYPIQYYEEVIAPTLRKECSQFIKLLRSMNTGAFLRYSAKHEGLYYFEKVKPYSTRSPKDMAKEVHDEFNKAFQKKFGWKARDGVFTWPRKYSAAKQSSTRCICFPVNGFQYVFGAKVYDLYTYWNEEAPSKLYVTYPSKSDEYEKRRREFIEEVVNKEYTNRDLRKAFEYGGGTGGVEVSWKCNAFYMVGTFYFQFLERDKLI